MNLNNFEQEIDPVIIDRGISYFKDDLVEELERISKSKWMATVSGTDMYNVEIKFKGSEIADWDCDCPYDWGPVCKHVVAVMYAIREKGENQEIKKSAKKKTLPHKTKEEQLTEILQKVNRDELISFVVDYANENTRFLNEFLVHFIDLMEIDSKSKYRQLIKSIFKSYSGRYGFIDYNNSFKAFAPIDDVLRKAEKLLNQGNYSESIAICQAVIEEVPVIIQNMDDSAGLSTTSLDWAFEVIYKNSLQITSSEMKDQLFRYCLEEFPKKKYTDFCWEDHFLDIIPALISNLDQEKKFLTLLDNEIQKYNRQDRNFRVQNLLEYKLKYFQHAGKEQEIRNLIEENIHYHVFRDMLVVEAIEKKDYNKAKELINEGINIAKKVGHSGPITQWKKRLLNLAEAMKNTEEIRKLSEELFLHGTHEFEFYEKLKRTYNITEWKDVLEKLIGKLKNEKIEYHNPFILGRIYVKEKYFSRLLDYLQQNYENLRLVEEFSEYLKRHYPKALLQIYKSSLYHYAQQTGRRFYNDIVRYMQKLQKIQDGEKVVKEMVQYFKYKYKNRRAMMEILNRHFK